MGDDIVAQLNAWREWNEEPHGAVPTPSSDLTLTLRTAARTIGSLNRDLMAELQAVGRLRAQLALCQREHREAAAEIIHLRAELVAVRAERDYWQREASR